MIYQKEIIMSNVQILEEALRLKPQEKFMIIETLLQSLDQPDNKIDDLWANEAEKRLQNYRNQIVKTFSFSEVFDL